MKAEGVLPVFKPAGITSHDVVGKVRRILGIRRIGHTGTLDPDVSGVLPLCIGRATRIVEWLQELPKTYEAVLHIGMATDTEDESGTVTARADEVKLDEDEIRAAMSRFVGTIEQVPPMYSALKHEGRRLYELAREGVLVERKPRRAVIYRIDIQDIEWRSGHPYVRFTVQCSKGTYVRTLCADIGKALGYPAVMHSLVRTESGGIALGQCLTLEAVAAKAEQGQLDPHVIPVDQALRHFPAARLQPEWTSRAHNGQKLPRHAGRWPETGGLVRLYDSEGRFVGIYRKQDEEACWVPVKLFV